MSKWRPIETAPKDGTSILIFGKWDGEISDWRKVWPQSGVAAWQDNEWSAVLTDIYGVWCALPTHWMPLPKPPTQEREG